MLEINRTEIDHEIIAWQFDRKNALLTTVLGGVIGQVVRSGAERVHGFFTHDHSSPEELGRFPVGQTTEIGSR